jgi:hypothetical protein
MLREVYHVKLLAVTDFSEGLIELRAQPIQPFRDGKP